MEMLKCILYFGFMVTDNLLLILFPLTYHISVLIVLLVFYLSLLCFQLLCCAL